MGFFELLIVHRTQGKIIVQIRKYRTSGNTDSTTGYNDLQYLYIAIMFLSKCICDCSCRCIDI